MQTKVIGITGPARSGKDTVANRILDMFGGYRYSFADPIRAMLKAGFGIDMDSEYWKEHKEEPAPLIGRSPRYLMQTLGTEWGRQLVADDIWLKLAEKAIEAHPPLAIIADVRFENEAAFVRRNGVLIHVRRPGVERVREHASEAGVAFESGDLTIQNDVPIWKLYDRVDATLVRALRAMDAADALAATGA